MIVWVNVVLSRTVAVDSEWRFDNLCGSHLQSQSELLWVLGYWPDWSIYRFVLSFGGRTGSSIQDQMLHATARPLTLVKPATLAREWPNISEAREMAGDVINHWLLSTYHLQKKRSNRLGLCDLYHVFYRLLSTIHFRKLVYHLRTNATES